MEIWVLFPNRHDNKPLWNLSSRNRVTPVSMKRLKHWETSRNTETLTIWCDDIGARCRDIGASTSALGVAISALTRSFWWYRRGVSGDMGDFGVGITLQTPLEFFLQEQSYSSLHSGRNLAWDHVRGDIDDPCSAIANFCGVVAIPEAIDCRRCSDADRCATR